MQAQPVVRRPGLTERRVRISPFPLVRLRMHVPARETALVMGTQLSGPYWTYNRKMGQLWYRSIDGRFEACNTWSVEKIREPNWVLTDLVTGRSYRFFVRLQLEKKIETLLAQAGSPHIKNQQHD
jgi:hypothetical protein